MPSPTYADALMIESRRIVGVANAERLSNLRELCLEYLGPGRHSVRDMGVKKFVTRDPADTILFGRDHPRAGTPRYDWKDAADGIKVGTLKEPTHAKA